MKKLKLYPKTFLYTLAVMLLIAAVAHIVIYYFAPNLVLSYKNFTAETGEVMIESVQNSSLIVKQAILGAMPISLVCCVVIALVCSLFFSKAITVPVKEISSAAGRMATLDKNARCAVRSGDEIGALAANVNGLYENLLSSIESLREEKQKVSEAERSKIDFLRAASHELKTPVTALNAMLENMILGVGKYKDRDACLPACKELTDRLSAMIQGVLDTSRLDFEAASQAAEPFDLSPFLHAVCEPFEWIAKAKGVRFEIETSPGITLPLPKQMFEKIVTNVVSNAVAYTAPGDQIRIRTTGRRLIVENQCRPIAAEDVPRLFEPFYRPDFARDRRDGGNGLGLYIVDALSKALGLQYAFAPESSLPGMRFTLFLSI